MSCCCGGGRISEATRCRRARPDHRRVVATVVKAVHHQSDLQGRPLPPHTVQDPTAAGPWLLWSKPSAASRISQVVRCCRGRPDRRRAVVEAARHAMVAGARLGGGVNVGSRPPSYSLGGWLDGKKWQSNHSTASVASVHALPSCHLCRLASRRRKNERERENGRERTTRGEKDLASGTACGTQREHTIRLSLLDARDWSEKRGTDRSTFFLTIVLGGRYYFL
jgi:hypothetical protein